MKGTASFLKIPGKLKQYDGNRAIFPLKGQLLPSRTAVTDFRILGVAGTMLFPAELITNFQQLISK